jgi:hypothetical protein
VYIIVWCLWHRCRPCLPVVRLARVRNPCPGDIERERIDATALSSLRAFSAQVCCGRTHVIDLPRRCSLRVVRVETPLALAQNLRFLGYNVTRLACASLLECMPGAAYPLGSQVIVVGSCAVSGISVGRMPGVLLTDAFLPSDAGAIFISICICTRAWCVVVVVQLLCAASIVHTRVRSPTQCYTNGR